METVLIFASQVMMVIMEHMAEPGMDRDLLAIIAMAVAKEGVMILVLMDAIILVAPDVGLDAVIIVLAVAIENVVLHALQNALGAEIIIFPCKKEVN